jgi:hypothetical protein
MLSAVYTHKLSIVRNLANRWKGTADAATFSSGHTFYQGEVEVARLYNYLSAPSRIEVKGKHFLLRPHKRVVLFTQDYTLERDGRTVATAKETKLFFHSNSRISYSDKPHSRELTVKSNFWKLLGGQYLVWDGNERVGVIEHDSNFGADIDLPAEIPLPVQIFIYTLAFIMWQRWR